MTNLQTMTLKELRAMAKSLKVKGWWEIKKDELITAIEKEQVVEEIVQDEPEEVVEEVNVDTTSEEENAPEVKPDAPKKKNHKRLIEYKGETKTLTAWAKELGIRHQTLYNRIVMKGMDPVEAFEMPLKKGGKDDK